MKKIGFALLVGLTLFISLLWHLSANWILTQGWVRQQLPPSLSLTQTRGVWWQGETRLLVRPANSPRSVPLGTLSWRWRPFDLLTGALTIDLTLTKAGHQVQTTVRQTPRSLTLQHLNGGFSFSQIRPFLPAKLATFRQVKGNVRLNNLTLTLNTPLSTLWPTQLQGAVLVNDFNAFGVALKQLHIHPSLENKAIRLQLQNQNPGWQLNGHLNLFQDHRYQTLLRLKSDTSKSLPAWSKSFFNMQTPTEGTFNNSGRW